MKTYKVWTRDVNGTWTQYEGNDREAFDAAVAKHEAYNEQARANKSHWGPKVRQYFTQITETECEPTTAPEIEEATPPVEQSAPALVASKGDPTDANARQYHSTRISDFRSEKPWSVIVHGNRRTGGRLSTTNIYDFGTLNEAKASIAYHTGWCSQATVYGHTSRHADSAWVSWRQEPGCYYDQYDEYCKAWDAGAFNAAFERDEENHPRGYHEGYAR